MSYPIVSKKYQQDSLVLPQDLYKNLKSQKPLPSKAILCFSRAGAESLKKRKDFIKTFSFYKTDMNIDLYQRVQNKKTSTVCVVSQFGIGASAAVVCLEKLRVLGVSQFISVGVLGSLDLSIALGTKVLLVKSFRDEGCSYHYQKATPYITFTESKLSRQLKKYTLQQLNSWTTDAPFRVSKKEIIYFKSQGVECIEMESSALMATGQYYGLSILCLGVVSDFVSIKGWTPQFSHSAVKKSLYELLNQVLF